MKLDGRENTFVIEPHTVPQLERISFSYDSVYGTVKSGWEKTESGYTFSITVPANCRAEVRLPGEGPEKVRVLEAGTYTFAV